MRLLKGQSATEYLMTYGWALLAIAIVGGLLYMYVFSNKECPDAVRPASQQDIIIPANQYQVYTNGSIKFILKNGMDKTITVKQIEVDGNSCVLATPIQLAPGEQTTIDSDTTSCSTGTLQANPSNENACVEVGVDITYDVQDGLPGVKKSRTILTKSVAP